MWFMQIKKLFIQLKSLNDNNPATPQLAQAEISSTASASILLVPTKLSKQNKSITKKATSKNVAFLVFTNWLIRFSIS